MTVSITPIRLVTIKIFIAVTLIFLATWSSYQETLKNHFLSDSVSYLVDNPFITRFSFSNLQWMLTTLHHSNWHPLTWLSFTMDYWLYGGLEAWGFHLTNVIIHGINSGLLFFLTLVVLGLCMPVRQRRYPLRYDNKALLSAFIAALFFAVHPQHVESVAWVAERKDVLFLLFFLLSLLSYSAYAVTLANKKMRWYVMAILSFVLSIASKPMAVTLPAVLLLMDIYPLRRTPLISSEIDSIRTTPYFTILLEKVPFALITGAVIGLTVTAQSKATVAISNISLLERSINAFDSIIFYIRKFIIPIDFSPLYLHPYLASGDIDPSHYISVLGCVLITVLAVYVWRQQHYAPLASWLFYLVTLSPVLGIIQVGIQSVADRYAYLPTIPIYFFLAAGIFKCLNAASDRFKFVVVITAFALSMLLVLLTERQVKVWQNRITLWSHAIRISPDNGYAHGNLGAALYLYGYYDEADIQFEWAHKRQQLGENLTGAYILNSIKLNKYLKVLELNIAALFRYNEKSSHVDYSKDCLIYNIGWSYFNLGRFKQALYWLQLVDPSSIHAVDAKAMLSNVDVNSAEIPEACREIEYKFSGHGV